MATIKRQWGYIVTFSDELSDERVNDLGMALAALPDVDRVMGPHQGTVEQCECPDCRAGRVHPPAAMTQ